MKNSLYILAAFLAGILAGRLPFASVLLAHPGTGKYALYLLMLLVGMGIGADPRSLKLVRAQGVRLFLLPLATLAGTFTGVAVLAGLLEEIGLREALAVGAGFGYYSLSSILITQLHSESLGVVALLSNIIREVLTLILAPLMVIVFGKLAPIAAAGATSMDTTLPVISRVSGREFAIIALFHGILLTILVPIMVPAILRLFPGA